jgi:hypothetical protein
VKLEPGLNIVWSPDPSDAEASSGEGALGHGSGKTLFCRLLRYCLGERRFATRDLQRRIAHAFPEGSVGIEAVVDGVTWSVVRPLAPPWNRAAAAPSTSIEDVESDRDLPSEGFEAFVRAVTETFIPAESRLLLPVSGGPAAWATLLAMLTRDQESRFTSALAWRSKRSDSGSPVRDLSGVQRLQVLRVLIDAIDRTELDRGRQAREAQTEHADAETSVDRLTWQIDRSFHRLQTAVGPDAQDLAPNAVALEVLRKLVRRKLAQAARVEPADRLWDPEVLRDEARAARKTAEEKAAKLARAEASLKGDLALLETLEREDPVHLAALDEAELPVCPICAVPIDRALAEGCKLSHKLPDLDAHRERWRKRQEEARDARRAIREWQTSIPALREEQLDLAAAADAAEARADHVARMHRERHGAWYEGSRLLDDIDNLRELLEERDAASARLADAKQRAETHAKQLTVDRERHRPALRRLDEHFTAIIRSLVGEDARGRVVVKGSSLALKLELAGERSTPAIESLKVLALDLAILCLTLEGRTHLPPFLLHDSPREADMGLSLYHRVFEVGAQLEREVGPCFQYIVTTTTRPAQVAREPALTLSSAPPDLRLLRRDL